MIDSKLQKEIESLINSGFDDLELISFELDIPIEEIVNIKNNLNKPKDEKPARYRTRTMAKTAETQSQNTMGSLRIAQIRQRYKKLYFCATNENDSISHKKGLNPKELAQIDSAINNIELLESQMGGMSLFERRKQARKIISQLKGIENYIPSVEQAQKLYSLVHVTALDDLSDSIDKQLDKAIGQHRKKVENMISEAVVNSDMNDEDKIKILSRIMSIKSGIVLQGTKSMLTNKTSRANNQKAIDNILKNVDPSIEAIVIGIANGQIDVLQVQKTIEREAKRRVESKPKTKFSLTEEQEIKQIRIQIGMILSEKAEDYNIENPEDSIAKMQQINGGNIEQAFRVVMKNLLAKRDIERAKKTCDKFSGTDPNLVQSISGFRKEIRNAEIADMVLKGIHMQGTADEEEQYFKTLEKGIRNGNIKLGAVSLGKNQDGSKTITLADIWDVQRQR